MRPYVGILSSTMSGIRRAVRAAAAGLVALERLGQVVVCRIDHRGASSFESAVRSTWSVATKQRSESLPPTIDELRVDQHARASASAEPLAVCARRSGSSRAETASATRAGSERSCRAWDVPLPGAPAAARPFARVQSAGHDAARRGGERSRGAQTRSRARMPSARSRDWSVDGLTPRSSAAPPVP